MIKHNLFPPGGLVNANNLVRQINLNISINDNLCLTTQ